MTSMTPSELLARLFELGAAQQTVLVAIDGLGGAGKTVLSEQLASGLKSSGLISQVVHFDDFFLPSSERPHGSVDHKPVGGDFDWVRLHDEVLAQLRRGWAARYQVYDWRQDVLAETQAVAPGGIVIIEGVYSSRRELAPLYDLRVWVECPRALRLARCLERDGAESHARWEHDWMPMEDRYVVEHDPEAHADIIVHGALANETFAAQPRPMLSKAESIGGESAQPAILVVTGVSGAGKTSVVRCLEDRAPAAVRCFYFDSIGVPSVELMRRDFGSPEAWQADATKRWIAHLMKETGSGTVSVLDAQVRPSLVRSALTAAQGFATRIVLLECDIPVRNARLVTRGNPELATPRLDNWASYLRGQADALELAILDTTNMNVQAATDALAAEIEALTVAARQLKATA